MDNKVIRSLSGLKKYPITTTSNELYRKIVESPLSDFYLVEQGGKSVSDWLG